MSSSHGAIKKFNAQEFLGKTLSFIKYARLAFLLLVVGLLAGIVYYVFSDALYFSRGLINVRMFNYAVDSGEEGKKEPPSRAKRGLATQLKSPHLLKQVAINMGFADENTNAGVIKEKFVPRVSVGFEDNDHLELEVYSTSANIVRAFPDALIETYQKIEAAARRDYREHAVTKYMAELEEIKEKLAKRHEAKSKFEEENQLVDIFVAQKQLSQIPVEIVWVRHRLTQMDELRSSLGGNEDRLSQLTLLSSFSEDVPDAVGRIVRPEREGSSPIAVKETAEAVIRPEQIAKRSGWESLEKERRLTLQKLNTALGTYGPKHATVKAIQEQLSTLESKIQLELETALAQFDREYAKLKAREVALENQLPQYHEITKKYELFRLDFELLAKGELAWDKVHQEISKRIAALEFGADKDRVEMRFTGHTTLRDETPVSPSKLKLFMISLVLGIGLSTGIPALMEMFNNTASRLQQIESATGLVGLGIVPLCDQDDLENVARSPTLGATVPNQLLENFRIIRSNICLHPNHADRSQVVMVTSARPSEGKTTQAANIAWAFNSIGERTLLVDADLRRGRVHALTQIDNSMGLTSILVGQAKASEVIQQTELANLDVITRGPIIAGSTEILSKPFFEELVAHWRKTYDRIVIDTPPVLGLSETTVVQRVADGVVVVIRAEMTPEKDIVDAVVMLRKSGAHLYGFVLNRIDLNKTANYYQYQYYSADYYADFEEPDEVPAPVVVEQDPTAAADFPESILPEVRRPSRRTNQPQ